MDNRTPRTEAQWEMYEFCKKFLRTHDNSVIDRYGKGKLHNIPFNYCMAFQICGYEEDAGRVGNPRNREELEKSYAQLVELRPQMEMEVLLGE